MTAYSNALDGYGAYLNARAWAESHLDDDELELFQQDLTKARAEMERAWLESTPTQGDR